MTSIKIHFRLSNKEGAKEGKLFYRIIHKRKSRTINTNYQILASEWDKANASIILPLNDPHRHEFLCGILLRISDDLSRLDSILSRLSLKGDYEIDQLVKTFIGCPESETISGYCLNVSHLLEQNNQYRTARAYRSAVNSLCNCFPGRQISLMEIDAITMKEYEKHLIDKGLHINTISFYMRQLRALYNRAVRDRIISLKEVNPFANVYTGDYRTKRRALTEKELNELASLEFRLTDELNTQEGKEKLDMNGKLKKALFIFLFCFHARGMSYVDMAFLKKSDIGKDTILYRRKKTGRFLEVGITKPMREIMDYFAKEVEGSPYVFPVIDPAKGKERTQYESGLRFQNRLLGILSKMAGIEKKITTHVSRHTWASVAKWHEVSLAVISEALGHSDFKTTEHYLASFEQSKLDQLSRDISAVIKKGKEAA